MPWRLLALVVILALSLVFVGFNLDNKCTVSFGFAVIENVPVFFPLLAAFTAGMLFSFPFVFRGKKNRNVTKLNDKQALNAPANSASPLLSDQSTPAGAGMGRAQAEKK